MNAFAMKILNHVAAALAALALLTGAKEAPSRLDVSSVPDGAHVFVDGERRGATPCSVFDLPAGRHLVHVETPSYKAVDEFVKISGPGDFQRRSFSLEPERALILIRTEPAGADVRMSGVSMGSTPLLLAELPTGRTHVFELSKTGYQTKKIDVSPEGRTPVVRVETLALDSGIVECTSDPAGAAVVVNGVERGATPVVVRNVPKGLATISMKLAGYRDEVRELRLAPGDRQTLFVRMKSSPARLKVVSTPEQAKVFVDGDYQGKTPLTVQDVRPGKRELRIELAGHAPVTRSVTLGNGEEKTEEFKMASVMGRIEVTSTPPGARVFVDGKSKGATRAQGGDAAASSVLSVEGVSAGEHSVVVRLDGYQEFQRKVVVKAKDTVRLFPKLVRLFVPNVEVETIRGTYRGVLVGNDPINGVTLEVKKGVISTFPINDVKKIAPLAK